MKTMKNLSIAFGPEFDDQSMTYKGLTLSQKLAVVGLDIVLLAELCIAIRQAHFSPEVFEVTFVKVFLSMCLPTLLMGFFAVRYLGRRARKEAQRQSSLTADAGGEGLQAAAD